MVHRRGQVVELGEPRSGLLAQLAAVVGIEQDRLLDHADRLARPLRLVVVRAQQVERVVAHAAVGVRTLEDALEQRAHVVIVLGLGEQRLGRRQRARRVVQVVEPARRDPRAGPLALALGLAVEPAFPQRDQVRPPLVALAQALEALADLDVVGDQRQQPLVVADRLVGLVRDILRQLRGLAQQLDPPRLVLRGRQRRVVEPERVAPALRDRIDDAQPLQRGVRGRREHADAAQDLLEHAGVVAEPLVAERARALADHLGDLGLELARQRLGVQRDDVVGAIEIRGERLGLVPRADRVWRMLDGGGGFLQLSKIGHGFAASRAPSASMPRNRITQRCWT